MLRKLIENKGTRDKLYKYIFFSSINNIINGIEVSFSTNILYSALFSDYNNEINSSINKIIIKDIAGSILGIPIIYPLSKLGDKNSSKFVLYNSMLFEISIFIDFMVKFFPDNFILLSSSSNILKSSYYVGYSSINMKISNFIFDEIKKTNVEYQDNNENNICQISSIKTVISTISFSLGSLIGIYLIYILPDTNSRLFLIIPFGLIRYYNSRKMVKIMED